MSNQIVISSGAKVRNLDGVLTGTSGIVNSVPLGAANGVATLDSGGKVPVSQLPSSVVTYLGTWNAATNTPTLVNGTGDAGDMYICNVAGTVNFGAGPVTFAVGDWVLYGSGTWQKSNGQNGTVTSVGVSRDGDALSITGSPITTAGTINIGFSGSNAQYINGEGDLVTFPSLAGFVPYTGATGSVDLGAYNLTATGVIANSFNAIGSGVQGGYLYLKQGSTPYAGLLGSNGISADGTKFLLIANVDASNNKIGLFDLGSLTNNTNRTFTLPDLSGTLALTSNLSAYVPYTGATANLNLGTFDLTADAITGATGSFASSGGSDTFAINHSSGSGIALNITKGGNGEGLYINKTSGSGNAATIIGTLNATTLVKNGGTSSQFLKADGSIDSNTYATTTQLGNYLPLIGGTLTGDLTISKADTLNVLTLSSTNTNVISFITSSVQKGEISVNASNFQFNSETTNGYIFKNSAANNVLTITDAGVTTLIGALSGTSATFSVNQHSTIVNSFTNTNTTSSDSRTILNVTGGNATLQIQSIHNTGIYLNPTTPIPTSIGYNNTLVLLANGNTTLSGQLGLGGALSGTSATFSGALTVNGLINNTYSDNAFLGLLIRNTNTGNSALSGFSIQNSGGTTVGQVNYVSTVYANTTLRNTLLINTVFDNKLAFVTNSSGGETRADIYFSVNPAFALDATNPNQIHILGTSRNVAINYSGTDYGQKFQVNGSSYFGDAATFSSSVTAGGLFTAQGGVSAAPATSGTTINGSAVIKPSDGSNAIIMGAYGTAPYGNWIQSQSTSALGTTFPLILQPNGGNVGIGTSSPYELLTINNGTQANSFGLQINNNVNNISGIGFAQYGSNATYTYIKADGRSSGYFAISTNDTERMRITSDGDLLVATTIILSGGGTDATNGFRVAPNGTIVNNSTADANAYFAKRSGYSSSTFVAFYVAGTYVGAITTNGSATSYTTASDYRLKQDLKEYNGLDLISKIKTYDYQWKSDNTRSFGVIAHELQEIIPQAVNGEKDGKDMQGVDYSKLVPILVKSIQELEARIKQLENK